MTEPPEGHLIDGDGPEDPSSENASHTIKVKGSDGEWHELSVEPKRTGDPDLDTLWAMSIGAADEIAEDPEHPLQEKARQVQREALEPITNALNQQLSAPITESIANSLDTSARTKPELAGIDTQAWLPAIDTSKWVSQSWVSKILPDITPPSTINLEHVPTRDRSVPVFGVHETPVAPVSPPTIDFDAVELPTASLADVAEASEAKAQEIRAQQVELLQALLAQARSGAKTDDEALVVAKASRKASWVAAWAAIVAAIISLTGILVAFLA